MSENDHNSSQQDKQDHNLADHRHLPRRKRIHHTWGFWLFLVLMLVGII